MPAGKFVPGLDLGFSSNPAGANPVVEKLKINVIHLK
jgi:hypothetical protein